MRGILFDKDGTLLDFHASWSHLYRELCLELADGDSDRAAAMLVAGGMDPESGRVSAGSPLAAATRVVRVSSITAIASGAAPGRGEREAHVGSRCGRATQS